MVRSRIGSSPSEANIAPDEMVERTLGSAHVATRRAPPSVCQDQACAERGMIGRLADALRGALRSGSLTFGCLLALGGGCAEESVRVDVGGVVVDDRTGAPIVGAQVSTDDGTSARTDEDGRFELSVEEGDDREITAIAEGHVPARERVDVHVGVEDVVIRLSPRSAEATDAELHTPTRDGVPALALDADAKLRVESCASCHAEIAAEWARSSMSHASLEASDDRAGREACASCHAGSSFVASRVDGFEHESSAAGITCGACHEPHADDGAFGLRVDDTSDPIAGRVVPHLGSGALCASCHRSTSVAVDAAPHAPQADMLVGRGARGIGPIDDGAHRHIADTCARCHMTPTDASDPQHGFVGGHTFAIRTPDARVSESACAPCHGETEPSMIGARDWNGDGVASALSVEHEGAMSRARSVIRSRIASMGVHDDCDGTGVAVDVVDHDARLHLIDADGQLLGDCNEDGRIGDGEVAMTTATLPREMARASYDVLLLARDGSAGAHNPAYAFRVFESLLAQPR